MTIREEPSKNYRSRTSEKWKAKENKIEETKKQNIKKGNDERSYANWQTPSWSSQQPMTWTSSFFHLGDNRVRTKRVSVPNGDHRVPGSHRSHLIFKDICKGIHDDEKNVCL